MDKLAIENITVLLNDGRYLCSLHYHETPSYRAKLYEQQLAYIANFKTIVSEKILEECFQEKPRQNNLLLIGIFDGYRTSRDVLSPILDKYNLQGWMMLVSGFLDASDARDELALELLNMESVRPYSDGRYGMNWEEAAEMAKKHIICNHTASHRRYHDVRDAMNEVTAAQQRISDKLGLKPKTVAFLGGESIDATPGLQDYLEQNGFLFSIGIGIDNIMLHQNIQSENAEVYEVNPSNNLCQQRKLLTHFTDGVPSVLLAPAFSVSKNSNTMYDAALFNSIAKNAFNDGLSEKAACIEALQFVALHEIGEAFPLA